MLFTNCFSEEAEVIRNSILIPFFDAVCMSFEEGPKKPDAKIYARCLERLGLKADECLYVGDGGSGELEAAQETGMRAVQAVWYLKEGTGQPAKRKNDFQHVETPLGILDII